MKPIACLLVLMMSLAACHDRDSDHNMPTMDDPAGDSNTTATQADTSTRNVQDTSTSIGYDTTSRR